MKLGVSILITLAIIYGMLHRFFLAACVLLHVVPNKRLPTRLVHDCEDVPELSFYRRLTKVGGSGSLHHVRKDPIDDEPNRTCYQQAYLPLGGDWQLPD